MGVAVALGIGSLALGVAGTASSASAGASSAKAQWMQQEINRKWAEFDKEMQLINARGDMGLRELDRLMQNATIERESLEAYVYGKRAKKQEQDYLYHQVYRQYQTIQAKQKSTLASRGVGRGGTADAIARQTDADFNSDIARMRVNNTYEMAAFKNARNQALRQRNMRPSDQPPTYIPSTPIPQPSTAGYTGQMLGAIAQGLGGLAGIYAGMPAANPAAGASSIPAMQATGGATAASSAAFGSGPLALGGTFT